MRSDSTTTSFVHIPRSTVRLFFNITLGYVLILSVSLSKFRYIRLLIEHLVHIRGATCNYVVFEHPDRFILTLLKYNNDARSVFECRSQEIWRCREGILLIQRQEGTRPWSAERFSNHEPVQVYPLNSSLIGAFHVAVHFESFRFKKVSSKFVETRPGNLRYRFQPLLQWNSPGFRETIRMQ